MKTQINTPGRSLSALIVIFPIVNLFVATQTAHAQQFTTNNLPTHFTAIKQVQFDGNVPYDRM